MMGNAAKIDVPLRKKAGVHHRMNPKDSTPWGREAIENGSAVSAISPRVGERTSQPHRWEVISL
jgi:hypothetical protein